MMTRFDIEYEISNFVSPQLWYLDQLLRAILAQNIKTLFGNLIDEMVEYDQQCDIYCLFVSMS